MGPDTLIIAEAGVNHNGDLGIAVELIDAAATSGADVVKFQTFVAEELVSRSAPKAVYQQRTTGTAESQFEMIRRLELSPSDHRTLVEQAARSGLRFLSTPFDDTSLRLLTDTLGLTLLKIGSGELTNLPFLMRVARTRTELILSTGMGNLAEVEDALGALAWGFVAPDDAIPQESTLRRCYASQQGQEAIRNRVTLLHCTTDYPAAPADVNLRAIATLDAAFGLPVGYSDHTLGTHISVAAVAHGARIIEKHLTLDRTLPGPDHEASLEPDEFRKLVESIRDVEQALGDGVKRAMPAEWANRDVARKSLVAACPIRQGDAFTTANLAIKRPGNGVPPGRYWAYLGRPADRDYATDELI